MNAKRAVLRGVGSRHADPVYADLERRILERLNVTGSAPLASGVIHRGRGIIKAADPYRHVPVALNLNCHSLRYAEAVL